MARFPQPFFRAPRKLRYVQIGKKQHNLGPNKDAAFAEYHRLMSQPQVTIDPTLVVKILDGFLTWEKGQRAARTYEGHRWHIQRFIDAVVPIPSRARTGKFAEKPCTFPGFTKPASIEEIAKVCGHCALSSLRDDLRRNPIRREEVS